MYNIFKVFIEILIVLQFSYYAAYWLRRIRDQESEKVENITKKVTMPIGDFALWRMTLLARERDSVFDTLLRYDIKIEDTVDQKLTHLPQIAY